MKEINLTQGYTAKVDDDLFPMLNQFNWHVSKFKRSNYASTNMKINGKFKKIPMHRYILNAPKGIDVDHIDGNGLNNQKKNLRLCTRSQNAMNQRKRVNTSSIYKGVIRLKKNNDFKALIRYNNESITIGIFDSEIDAAIAYDEHAEYLFGEFACTNKKLNLI